MFNNHLAWVFKQEMVITKKKLNPKRVKTVLRFISASLMSISLRYRFKVSVQIFFCVIYYHESCKRKGAVLNDGVRCTSFL